MHRREYRWLLVLPFLLAACASNLASVTVDVETTERTSVEAPERKVEVFVQGKDTVLWLGAAQIVFMNHAGYTGVVGVRSGVLRFGDVKIEYAGANARITGPKSWRNFTLTAETNLFVTQLGQVAPSPFKPALEKD
jgi:hypothetical protein